MTTQIAGVSPTTSIAYAKPTSGRKFAPWRIFQMGGVSPTELIARVQKDTAVNVPDEILTQATLFTPKTEITVRTIILTPAILGRKVRTPDLFSRDNLATWSKIHAAHLPVGYVVDLLPLEVVLPIRDQYKDQPEGETLCVATERFASLKGKQHMFTLGKTNGKDWLNATIIGPEHWSLCTRIVFQLRKIAE